VAFYLRRLGLPPEAVIPAVTRAHELAPDEILYRTALAALLDHIGRREDAVELLQNVNLGSVRCRCCLRRVSSILRADGDVPLAQTCRTRADRVDQ
jgi:hypothetical protein